MAWHRAQRLIRVGRTPVALETGALQPEAIAMYEVAGYALIPNFGYYRHEPDVRSVVRVL
jgi:hypothetical protein